MKHGFLRCLCPFSSAAISTDRNCPDRPAEYKQRFAENPTHVLPMVTALGPVRSVGFFSAITSAIRDGIGLTRCDACILLWCDKFS